MTDDLFENEMEPALRLFKRHHVTIQAPAKGQHKVFIRVVIDDTGYLEVDHAYGFGDIGGHGKGISQEQHACRMEVYSYLTEWDLAKWQQIGPEDSELFATKKLDPEWGIE